MPRKRGEPTDQQVIALWLAEQDPETRVRIQVTADAMRARFNENTPNERNTMGEGTALEILYRIGRRAQGGFS